MDESAEWRLKYDEEVSRANKCLKQLQVVSMIFFGFLLPFKLNDGERFSFKFCAIMVGSALHHA